MELTEEQTKAVSRYNAALKKVQSGLDARSGGPGAEVEYALAYKALVMLGLAAPVKLKYSRGKALKQVR